MSGRVTAHTSDPDTCVCGAEDRCIFCRAPMCCGPDKAGCDAADHCDQCLHECSLCRTEMRP